MKVVNSQAIHEADRKYVKVEIYADSTPNPMPTTADIPGYDESYYFFPGSTLYVVGTGDLYMTGETNNWVKQ